MGAVTLIPDPTIVFEGLNISPDVLSVLLAGMAVVLLGISLSVATMDRRNKGALNEQKVLLDSALENMSQGLAMFDAEGRILLFNERYMAMLRADGRGTEGTVAARCAAGAEGSRPLAGEPDEFFARLVADAHAGRGTHQGHGDARAVDADRHSAEAERRLGCHLRGHHRMAARAGADLAHGAP